MSKRIITISREFGSGGRSVGHRVAQLLDVPYYDKELVKQVAVETGFDTDCNGATVGSILGMALGIGGIGPEWTEPVGDTLHTSIFGVGTVKISECAKATMRHVKMGE